MTAHLLKALNQTFFALIPNIPHPRRVEQFGPISLCNMTYKVISKLIVDKHKPHLPQIIFPFQLAFVAGRNINDNNTASHETINYLHNRKGKKHSWPSKLTLPKLLIELYETFLL